MKKLTDITEIQNILYENLIHFDYVCRKNNLKYYLSNGTLLGAIKYQGFVPWDDDIDVFMPRQDYEQLMKVMDYKDGNYVLMSREVNPKWKVPYTKIKDKRTFVQETTADFGLENGLSIDVFPLDSWSNHRKSAIRQAKYCGLLRRFLTASIEKEFMTPKKGIQKWILYFIWKYSHIKGEQYFNKKVERIIEEGKKTRNPAYMGNVVWSLYGEREVLTADIFEHTIEVDFCGSSFYAPAGYDRYLRCLYGEYELDPPLEKQKSHHQIDVWWKGYYE